MSRQGTLDPWSGQRPAFPLEEEEGFAEDPESQKVLQYLKEVRTEARSLALNSINLKRKHDSSSAPRRPAIARSETLNYTSPDLPLAEIAKTTSQLFGGGLELNLDERANSGDKLVQLYHQAYAKFSLLEPCHPEECQTLATWKTWTAQNMPVPVNHQDTFRLYKYLVRWCGANPPEVHFIWAWSLLLRTPNVLRAEEVAVLRDLCKSMAKHEEGVSLAKAFIRIVATVFGQADLIN